MDPKCTAAGQAIEQLVKQGQALLDFTDSDPDARIDVAIIKHRHLEAQVVEADPPWARPELSAVFTASFGPAVCTQIKLAEMIAGREATAADMEPLSWAI